MSLTPSRTRAETRLPGLLELSVGGHLASYPYFFTNLVWGVILSLTLSNDIRRDNLSTHILAVAIAQGIFSLMLAAAYQVNKARKNPISPRLFLLVFLGAGAIRGAILQFLLGQLQLTTTFNYEYRVYTGITSVGLSAWFWAILFGVVYEWRRQASRLATERNYLEKLQTEVDSVVTSATDLEIDAFRTYLLANLSFAGKADAAALRNELTRVINEVIRPVVDQMLLRRTAVSPPDSTDAEERVNPRNVIENISAKRSFQPLIQVLPATPAAIAGAFVLFGYRNGLAAMMAFMLGWPILLLLAKYSFGVWLDRLPAAPRAILLPFAVLLTGLPISYFMAVTPQVNGSQWVWLEFSIYALVTGMVLAVWFAYLTELARVYRVRDQFIHHIHWKVAEVNSRRWHQQLHFARRVHGSLQSEVAAMAIRLDKELAKPSSRATSIGDLQTTLEQKVQQVFEAPEVGLNPTDVLTEISETWAGICDISVSLTPTDAEQLMRDPIAVETALEVIREAVSNAIRHGSAKRVAVSVSMPDETIVRVEVTNDGVPLEAKPEATRGGTGSKHLEECSVEYQLTQSRGQTRLLADLPFRG